MKEHTFSTASTNAPHAIVHTAKPLNIVKSPFHPITQQAIRAPNGLKRLPGE